MSKQPAAPKVDVDDPLLSVDASEDKPEESQDTTDFEHLLSSGAFSEAINKLVEEQVASKIGSTGSPNKFVAPGQQNAPAVTPTSSFLKHYRNDSSPEIQVVELDMDSESPRLNPLPGSPTIRFRRGHFFATTENQVKQIEWMMAGAKGVTGAKEKFGGSVGIYEDPGEVLYYCPHGCSADVFVSATKSALDAHLRATHGMET